MFNTPATMIAPFVLIASLTAQAMATTITIPEHDDFTITLQNTVNIVATDVDVIWKKGTKIKTATPDGVHFTLSTVNARPNEAIFYLGTGLSASGTINLTFSKSFAPGSQFDLYFSYQDDILGEFLLDATIVDQHIGPPTPDFPRQLLVQPVPVALPSTGILMIFVLMCSGAFARLSRRAHSPA